MAYVLVPKDEVRSIPHGHTAWKPRTAYLFTVRARRFALALHSDRRIILWLFLQTAFSERQLVSLQDPLPAGPFGAWLCGGALLHECAGCRLGRPETLHIVVRRPASPSRPARRVTFRRSRFDARKLSTVRRLPMLLHVPVPGWRRFQLFASLRVFQDSLSNDRAGVYAPRPVAEALLHRVAILHSLPFGTPLRRMPIAPQATCFPVASPHTHPFRFIRRHTVSPSVRIDRFLHVGRVILARGRLIHPIAHRSGFASARQSIGRTDGLRRIDWSLPVRLPQVVTGEPVRAAALRGRITSAVPRVSGRARAALMQPRDSVASRNSAVGNCRQALVP